MLKKKVDFKYNPFYLMLHTYEYTKCFGKEGEESDDSILNGDKRRKTKSCVTYATTRR